MTRSVIGCLILLGVTLGPTKAGLGVEPEQSQAETEVEFSRDIRPLLARSCHGCHGPERQEAGLRLDVKKNALAGSDNGAVIVPTKSAESLLFGRAAGLEKDLGRMPPEGEGAPLTSAELESIRQWIDRGAKWPDEADDAVQVVSHWSLQPLVRPVVPAAPSASNPIDAFVLAKLHQQQVAPSPPADNRTLLRRIYLDLIGLPPTIEQIKAFRDQQNPAPFESVVDELLASPHFGERWGRHWLDLARYADSDGFEQDAARPFAWRYRDWVIDAINKDLPFDRFSIQQLAGDLLRPDDREFDDRATLATGFHRNTLINKEGGTDPEEDRAKRTIDRTNTLGVVWLGLSVGCANCHTHKYDFHKAGHPITQREYFGLFAFFNNLREVDVKLDLSSSPMAEGFAQVINEESTPRSTYVHLRGDFLSRGPVVEPHTPEALPALARRGARADRLDLARWLFASEHPLVARVVVNRLWQSYFGRGLVSTSDDFGSQGEPPSHPELLDWLAIELRDNGWRLKPIHRLIVTSATYRQSSVPRNELLDRDPYNKLLARQNRLRVEAEIVRDLALCVSGLLNPAIGGPSVRPPQPEGVSEVSYANSVKWQADDGPARYRRGLYTWFQRTSPYPSLATFDAPESILSCSRRERSNTPLQALTLLNDVAFVEAANGLAMRMVGLPHESEAASNRRARIEFAFEVCLSRPPTPRETEVLVALYEQAFLRCKTDSLPAANLAENSGIPRHATITLDEANSDADVAACRVVARALLNLDEFITRE